MNGSHANSDESTFRKPTWFNWKLFSRMAKGLVVLIILGLGLQSFYAIYFSAAPTIVVEEEFSQLNDNLSQANQDPLAIFADFTSGAWKFGDQDEVWDFRLYSTSSAPADDSLPAATRVRDPDFDDQAVINQFLDLGIKPADVGQGLQRWASTGHGFSMTLFTRDGVVQMVRTRLPVEEGIALLEAVPKSKVDAASTKFLLPLLPIAKQTATRLDTNGRITSSIIQLESQKQIDIRTYWKENGWNVVPVSMFESDTVLGSDFKESDTNTKFRCNKGSTIVEATFLSEPDDPQATIILTLIAF